MNTGPHREDSYEVQKYNYIKITGIYKIELLYLYDLGNIICSFITILIRVLVLQYIY